MKRILIADAGSTKTDWALLNISSGHVSQFTGSGINPVTLSEESIELILSEAIASHPEIKEADKLYYYGAGCATPAICERLEFLLQKTLGCRETEVYSDLTGAARSLLHDQKGIACILGTGSNSCLYDGEKIVRNIPPLGYILGDEGSGTALGKRLISDLLKGLLPSEITSIIIKEAGLTLSGVIERVYREPEANRFLASVVKYIGDYKEDPDIRRIVAEEFKKFFDRNVTPYKVSSDIPICFTGSIAWHFSEILKETALSTGHHIKKIIKNPIEGLVEYHITHD